MAIVHVAVIAPEASVHVVHVLPAYTAVGATSILPNPLAIAAVAAGEAKRWLVRLAFEISDSTPHGEAGEEETQLSVCRQC